jgi:hypothetical protein
MMALSSSRHNPEGCGRSAGGATPGYRYRIPSRPGEALGSSFSSLRSFWSWPFHSAIRLILPRRSQAKAGAGKQTLESVGRAYSRAVFNHWNFSGASSLAFGSFPTPNSTLDLGKRPLNWGKNGLSYPQFNPPAMSKSIPKPLKIRAKSQRPTTHKPPPTKKLFPALESGCRRRAPALPAPAKWELCFWSPGSFFGAWRLDAFFSNLLQASPGFSNLLKHPLPPPGGVPLGRQKGWSDAKVDQGYPNLSKAIQGYPTTKFFSPSPICYLVPALVPSPILCRPTGDLCSCFTKNLLKIASRFLQKLFCRLAPLT